MIPQKAQRPPGGNYGSEVGDMKGGYTVPGEKVPGLGDSCVCFPLPAPSQNTSRLCSLLADVG